MCVSHREKRKQGVQMYCILSVKKNTLTNWFLTTNKLDSLNFKWNLYLSNYDQLPTTLVYCMIS